MKMLDVKIALEELRKAREQWGQGRTEFFAGYDWVLSRLLHQAAVNYMSASQVATILGVSPKTIRAKMRQIGLDPRSGKRVLSSKASEVLIENASIMGIEPGDMDLTSPLAYLPMGSALRQQYQDKTLARVTELDGLDNFVCPVPGCNCDVDHRAGVSGNDEPCGAKHPRLTVVSQCIQRGEHAQHRGVNGDEYGTVTLWDNR